MTGKNSGQAYIRGNDEWTQRGGVWDFKKMEENRFLEGQLPIPDSTITIAKAFKNVGYATGMVGKWGLGAPASVVEPNNQGFDYFYGFICQLHDHTYYPGHLWENNYRVLLSNKIIPPNVKFPTDLNSLDVKNYAGYRQRDYSPDIFRSSTLYSRNRLEEKVTEEVFNFTSRVVESWNEIAETIPPADSGGLKVNRNR